MRDQEQLYDIVEALVEMAEEHDVSAAQVALAWLLMRPGVRSGGDRGTHRRAARADNLACISLQLAAEELDRLESLSRPPLIYPYWHQAAGAKDRLSEADHALLEPFLA